VSELIGIAITRKIMGKMRKLKVQMFQFHQVLKEMHGVKKEIDKLPFYLKMIGMMLVKISTRTFTGQREELIYL
jgi:hypothetical protein